MTHGTHSLLIMALLVITAADVHNKTSIKRLRKITTKYVTQEFILTSLEGMSYPFVCDIFEVKHV